jgi:hypothetical protein
MSAAGAIILILVACSGVVAVIAAMRVSRGLEPRTGDGGDDGGGGGGGGSQPRVPPALPPGPCGIEDSPAWWPAFERQFADYVRRREAAGAEAR